jgi:hypothetical protein
MSRETTEPLVIRDTSGEPISTALWLARLREDPAHRAELTARLAASPFDAFFFEVAPVTRATAHRPAEIVLIDAPVLARIDPDPASFADRFAAAPGDDVLVFPNLGRDATLVVPAPRSTHDAYGHLAAFVRYAPPAQVDAFWRALATATERALGTAPLWLSTAGLGVPWLHFRLDSRPKYYRHAPFKRFRP